MAETPAGERAFLDPLALSRLMRQSLQARLPMVGNVSGLHKSPHRGSSVEFAEYRKYAPGDDPRRLDWRVYGRTDRFYIREFEADTNLRGYLVLDGSASMRFGQPSKFDYARRLLAHLAYLLVREGDAVGLQCVGDRLVRDIPPRRNPSHLRDLFDALERLEPRGGTGLAETLHEIAEKIPARALVVLFSDLLCEVEPLLNAFQHLRFQKHDLAVFHLLDRRELAFDFDRPMRFVDMEAPGSLLAEPEMVRRQYLERLQSHLDRIDEGCHRFDADYRRVVTDENMERVLADFLIERARSGRGTQR